MNTNKLKKFAQETRRKLLKQVNGKLEHVLNTDSSELRGKAQTVKELKKELDRLGREALVDKVAYTWFNRLVALRYMDARGYQPLELAILTPQAGQVSPQILQEAMAGHIPGELKGYTQQVMDILDGRTSGSNPENEAYRRLLVASCNHLHSIFPFLFETIDDYTELLLPDDLTSEFSIVQDVIDGMTDEDCQQVEILGWLYQFYISEKKDEVFASKGKVKKEEIPAATQLFTPRWIVEYMVQNTVGKLWVLNHPNSRLKEHMEYYIESEVTAKDVLTIDKPEELTLLDQACGSGHILVYGFELLYKIYEEEGYAPSDIPRLIIEHNLHGFEIDERAAQLAGLAILMKAREHQRRLFRKSEVPEPNITCFEDLTLSDEEIKASLKSVGIESSDELLHDLQNMQQATNFGSLIVPHASLQEIQKANTACEQAMDSADLFEKEKLEQLVVALETINKLGTKVCCVVDNPPYMGSGNMNKELSDFVKTNYSESKSDLMTCFMESGYRTLEEQGMLGMINQHSWMFLSSYKKLRKKLIDQTSVDTLLHLGARTFPEIGGEVVQNASFTLISTSKNINAFCYRLVDAGSSSAKEELFKKMLSEKLSDQFYKFSFKQLKYIPGAPVVYWLSDVIFKHFENLPNLTKWLQSGGRIKTHGNDKYMRLFWEVNGSEINDDRHWNLYENGGESLKWFGNTVHIVKWDNQAKDFYKSHGGLTKQKYWNKEGITWNNIGNSGFRFKSEESEYSSVSPTAFTLNEDYLFYLLGFMNTKYSFNLIDAINPTLSNTIGDILKLPIKISQKHFEKISKRSSECISISKKSWNRTEKSYWFSSNQLIQLFKEGGIDTLEVAYEHYRQYWTNRFFQLHQNEEELNRQFIEIYGLQEELTPDVPLDEITILQEELDRKKLVTGDRWLVTGDQSPSIKHQPPTLPFKDKEVFAQFISYAVGCMFGRYSLDKEGLILANQGETLEDYLRIVTGDWWFVNSDGKWEIDKTKDAYEHYNQLQRSENLERRDETDKRNLPGDESDAEAGNVWSDESDKESSSEHPKQHRGGTSEGNQGVHSLFKDSERVTGRTGYAAESDSRPGHAEEESGSKNPGRPGNFGEANQQPDQQTPKKVIGDRSLVTGDQAPTTNHQPLNTSHQPPITFLPDEDNIIPILDDEWFEDDIVFRFHEFLKASFGEANFQQNLAFVEEQLGHDIRKYFDRYFYNDHYKRYNKRPIYWKFSSPKGHFSVLIYMHRYTPDTLNNILNNYLREFVNKLKTRKEQMEHLENTGSASEKAQASKEIDKLNDMIADCQNYEREILYPLASERIEMDLDDGVLVNYNLFGKAVEEIKSVNDKKKKKKVKEFDWIDGRRIR